MIALDFGVGGIQCAITIIITIITLVIGTDLTPGRKKEKRQHTIF